MKFIKGIATSFTAMLIVLMISQSTYAFSGEIVLKSGMHGSNIWFGCQKQPFTTGVVKS